MKVNLIFLLLVPFIRSASIDLDPEDELNEDQFEEYFHLDPVTDPEEHERREEALKENEALIKENNDQYLHGNRVLEGTWWKTQGDKSTRTSGIFAFLCEGTLWESD